MSIETVPVISTQSLENRETLAALDSACREWGFFQVVDHGVSPAVLANLKESMHRFFEQPRATKRAISRTAENPWGYFDQEFTKNTLDWKEVFDYGPAEPTEGHCTPVMVPQWPRLVPGFREAILDYYRECNALSLRILRAVATNLGMPPASLDGCFQPDHTSFIRLNHYPACPTPANPEDASAPTDGFLGVNHHTDAGALTILLQADEPGLEVFHDDAWHLVEPREDAFVVNIGDIVQVWSNDRYRAALHRVTANTSRDRYSAPFFLNPAYNANYAPLPSTVDQAHPARYRSINWGEFRNLRSAGDYADLGDEIQISHYKFKQRVQP